MTRFQTLLSRGLPRLFRGRLTDGAGSIASNRRPATSLLVPTGNISLRRPPTSACFCAPCAFGGAARFRVPGATGGTRVRWHMGGSAEGTVDAEEVQKFGAFGSDWWEPNGPMKALHSYNKVRCSFLDGMAQHLSPPQGAAGGGEKLRGIRGLRVVDVGCGGGIFAEELCRMGLHVTAIDAARLSPTPPLSIDWSGPTGAENITIASEHAEGRGLLSGRGGVGRGGGSGGVPEGAGSLVYRHMTADALASEEGASFDLVVCSEVIEHVSDAPLMMRHLASLARPGGGVLVTTLNRTHISYALSIVAAERVLGLVPNGTHDWHKYITPEELSDLMGGSGLRVARQIGAAYNGISDEWYVVPDTSVNYLMFATKPSE